MDRVVQRPCRTGWMPATLCLLALVLTLAPLEAQTGSDQGAGAAGPAQAAVPPTAEAESGQAPWVFPSDDGEDFGEVSLGGLLLKVGLGLSFVVGLAWGCVFLLKKSAVGQQFAPATSGIHVLERTYLAPKRAIYLVEIGGRALALGVTEQSISVLSRWPAGQFELPEAKARDGGFASQFRSLLHRGLGADGEGEGAPSAAAPQGEAAESAARGSRA